ncbi:MAG: phosphate acyltransferase PlsX [Maricaulaceae bacterium]
MAETPLTISIDAMGGDHGPAMVIDGVMRTLKDRPDQKNLKFLLHGAEGDILPLLAANSFAITYCDVRHTELAVSMEEKPSQALRRSRGSSMWNAVAAVRDGEADVAVSAGNTGALMAISKVLLRMMEGVHRPAIAASWPTMSGVATVLDVGANVDCDVDQLIDFAILGEAFHRAVHDQVRPSVGLLNVGAEDMKGRDTVREADRRLKTSGLDMNYSGFVEGDDISQGAVDVVVTDGFTGNIALKTAEGTAKLVASFVKEALTGTKRAKAGALLARPSLERLRERMDPRRVNGGVFLGLNGVVVKSHGGTDGLGFATALGLAADMAAHPFKGEIAEALRKLALNGRCGPCSLADDAA